MLLSAGVAGVPFGGADVPSFHGNNVEHTFILGYQIGVFFPFFRAHAHIEFEKGKEPWLLSPRV